MDTDNDIVYQTFKTILDKNNFKIVRIDEEEIITIQKDEWIGKVSLYNIRKEYQRDADIQEVINFSNLVIPRVENNLPDWDIIKDFVYISFFPSDFDFQDFINKPITKDFHQIFICQWGELFYWVSKQMLVDWGLSEQVLEEQVLENCKKALNEAELQVNMVEDHKLGFFESKDHENLKASFLSAPNFKEKVMLEFGFPIYAVIPVRDFCIIFSEKDFDYLSQRLGNTVIEEYTESGYPITIEILKITEEGINAVGKYEVQK